MSDDSDLVTDLRRVLARVLDQLDSTPMQEAHDLLARLKAQEVPIQNEPAMAWPLKKCQVDGCNSDVAYVQQGSGRMQYVCRAHVGLEFCPKTSEGKDEPSVPRVSAPVIKRAAGGVSQEPAPSFCPDDKAMNPAPPPRLAGASEEARPPSGEYDEDGVRRPAWRVGRKLGRTLYFAEECVGIVDEPWQANLLVESVNGTTYRKGRAEAFAEAAKELRFWARNGRDSTHIRDLILTYADRIEAMGKR